MSNDTQHGLEVLYPHAIYDALGEELFWLILTEQNKAQILAYSLSKLDENQQEAVSLLDHLARWDPFCAPTSPYWARLYA